VPCWPWIAGCLTREPCAVSATLNDLEACSERYLPASTTMNAAASAPVPLQLRTRSGWAAGNTDPTVEPHVPTRPFTFGEATAQPLIE
jgi:hypothetical protein